MRTNELILYKNMEEGQLLQDMVFLMEEYENEYYNREDLAALLADVVNGLIELAVSHGFEGNLWQDYLTYLLASNENAYSTSCEIVGAVDGSINTAALHDFAIFKELFDYDFHHLQKVLHINCFDIISAYQAIEKPSRMCDLHTSSVIRQICRQLEQASDAQAMYDVLTAFYQQYGIGMFAMNRAFRFDRKQDGELRFLPIRNMDRVTLDDLVGYQLQKKLLVENTKAFVEGRNANNVLLYGDSGTGKSTSIKAIVNAYYDQGLRMIEIYKHQFRDLSDLIARLKKRNYRFIIYMDDLSFEDFETEYKFLKAVIEGGVETRPDNILIYATSNRRHLIKETWGDRSDMSEDELHHSDTIQEKLSLAARFGLSICYERPNQKNYFEIVLALAKRYPEITLSEEELIAEARKWELSHGGMSGRAAQQLIYDLSGKAMIQKWKDEKKC